MSREHWIFAMWALAITALATALIMYQHAQHTGLVIASIGGSATAGPVVAAASAQISSNPGWLGVMSRATGLWTPLGPSRAATVFPYQPAQPLQ
jgi:hypothetical protein